MKIQNNKFLSLVLYDFVVPNNPFKKITYSQALDELNGKDAKLEFGNDLLDSHLRILGENYGQEEVISLIKSTRLKELGWGYLLE